MKIGVIGLGFVGLSMSAVLASKTFKVIGADIDSKKILLISQGELPFFEPKLKELIDSTISKNLSVTTDIDSAVKQSDIIFICVGTPSDIDGSVNLSYIQKISQQIGEILKDVSDFKTIVVKSTVPPQTTNNIVITTIEKYSSKKAGNDFGICMNPEFLKEGSAVDDMFEPHLVVIGANDNESKKHLNDFYKKLYPEKTTKILNTNIVNAELIKYSNNAFLATKISFINTIANICNTLKDADVEVIAEAIGSDPRIGPLFLKAGPGFGGSCFPKDVSGFLNFAKSKGYFPELLQSTQKVNQDQASVIIEMIGKKIQNFKDQNIAILGLSFKKNTDDIRESVSIKIVEALLKKMAKIKVHDPMAITNFKKLFSDKISYHSSVKECIKNADCCVILTDWDIYSKLTIDDFNENMNRPCVIDARRIFDPNKMKSIDFSAIGYGS